MASGCCERMAGNIINTSLDLYCGLHRHTTLFVNNLLCYLRFRLSNHKPPLSYEEYKKNKKLSDYDFDTDLGDYDLVKYRDEEEDEE